MIFGIDTNYLKLIFAIIAVLIAVFGSFIPYIIDIFKKKTKPHVYTWLIWTITQGVAAAGLIYGKGGWAALDFISGTFFIFLIFLLALKYGTKNITKFDTVILILALLAILVWIKMDNPLLAVIMVSIIDFLAYLPSFRKSFQEPWTETINSWILFTIGDVLVILSLNQYNYLTLTYTITTTSSNLIIAIICLVRRKTMPKIIK